MTLGLIKNNYLIAAHFGSMDSIQAKTHDLIYQAVATLEGKQAKLILEKQGLRMLHLLIKPDQIGALRDLVMPDLRPDLLKLAFEIGRNLLEIEGEFFIDDYTILRINFPYLEALKASKQAENPGIGRTDHKTRSIAAANKVINPNYNPQAYHNYEPPPAWAHGPHQDSWTGHSCDGVNLWWAMEDVPEEGSMVFFPETTDRYFEPDETSLYLKAGQPLPKPTPMSLRTGEMLIFNPEMLHGTHLNISNFTRLAVSTRLNQSRPKFSPSCFYAREFWHSSNSIETGIYDNVIHCKRADNLSTEPEIKGEVHYVIPEAVEIEAIEGEQWHTICESSRLSKNKKLLVRCAGKPDILILRGEYNLSAVQANCAHVPRVSLADGFHDDQHIWCPNHAVRYSLESGNSSCPKLKLRRYDLLEENGVIKLNFQSWA